MTTGNTEGMIARQVYYKLADPTKINSKLLWSDKKFYDLKIFYRTAITKNNRKNIPKLYILNNFQRTLFLFILNRNTCQKFK